MSCSENFLSLVSAKVLHIVSYYYASLPSAFLPIFIYRDPDKIGHVGLLLSIRNDVEDSIPSCLLID